MSHLTLALDGSTYAASVALLDGGNVIAQRELSHSGEGKDGGRGEGLAPLINECLEETGRTAADIKRVICGSGPGSFTSLRVAASIAKGIAVAARAELYGVSSLMLTVAGLRQPPASGRYLSVLPAMRGESFAMTVVVAGQSISAVGTFRIVPDTGLGSLAASERARIMGPAREFDASPHARGVARLMESVLASGPVDVASWEPDYGRPAEAQVKWEAAHGRPLRA